jgi:hypothetical protein
MYYYYQNSIIIIHSLGHAPKGWMNAPEPTPARGLNSQGRVETRPQGAPSLEPPSAGFRTSLKEPYAALPRKRLFIFLFVLPEFTRACTPLSITLILFPASCPSRISRSNSLDRMSSPRPRCWSGRGSLDSALLACPLRSSILLSTSSRSRIFLAAPLLLCLRAGPTPWGAQGRSPESGCVRRELCAVRGGWLRARVNAGNVRMGGDLHGEIIRRR